MLRPRKWNLLCWSCLALWLLPSILGNIPFSPNSVDQSPPKGIAGRYETVHYIGCPLPYLQVSVTNGGTPVSSYNLLYLFLNVVLVPVTLFGIVFSIQTVAPRFSIKTLMLVTSFVVVVLLLGKLVLATNKFYLQIGFLYSIYFSPIGAAVLAYIFARYNRRDHK